MTPVTAIEEERERRRLRGEPAPGDRPKAKRERRAKPVAEQDAPWRGKLLQSDHGPIACEANVATMLRLDPAFEGRLRFNVLKEAVECLTLPWRASHGWRDWTDLDDTALAVWAQERGVNAKPGTCAGAVALAADDNRRHPVRDWLDRLEPDDTPRLDTWLEVYCGAGVNIPEGALEADREALLAKQNFVRQAGRKWLISAVARTYRDGCKADCALVLRGEQGIGKSSALAALVPYPEWFADEIADLGTKDSAQDLRGKWIVELAELSAMRRPEVERVKAFISRSVDHYRPSYGRRSLDFPRRCAFAGTTNSDAFLNDETGGRRFWPVRVVKVDVAGLRKVRNLLWAEAVAAFKAGEKWWLDAEVEHAASVEQAAHRIVDPWEVPLLEWANAQKIPVEIPAALLSLNLPVERHGQPEANRVARILKAHGWERYQRREVGKHVWAYRRLSPVSPVAPNPTGYGKPSDSAAVTSVTSVTSKFDANARAHTHVGSGEPTGDTGYTGYRQAGRGFSVTSSSSPSGDAAADTGDTPPWTDDRAWCRKVGETRRHDDKLSVVLRWGEAAGGTVSTWNDGLQLTLPPDLPRGMALVELGRFAREMGVAVSVGGRA